MRVVVNGWFLDQTLTGSGQYLGALAAVLPRIGAEGGPHELILALPAFRPQPASLPSGWRSVSIRTPFDRLNIDLTKLWFEQVAFPGLCRRLGADVGFVPYWGSPWLRPCPMVVTVHDLIPRLLPLYRGGSLQRAYTRLVSATARRAAAIITDSESSKRDIVAHLGIPAGRVFAIPLAADGCREDAFQVDKADVRRRLNLPPGRFLLYLGGFDARKNVLRTVQGYAQLVARMTVEGAEPPALVMAGKLPAVDSAFAPDPRPLIRTLGVADRIHFAGRVDETDKAALYRMAEGVLFISEYEGFGLPVLEAMACDHD